MLVTIYYHIVSPFHLSIIFDIIKYNIPLVIDTSTHIFGIKYLFRYFKGRKNMSKTEAVSNACPMELGINILSRKWKLRILWNLYIKKVVRFNELQRNLGNITTKTLTEQLRELEDKKIIKRTIYPEIPPKVEYSLTDIGNTIGPVLKTLCDWGNDYLELINDNTGKV